MQKLIDAKDAKIEELEAALGDPLSLWWRRAVWKSNFYCRAGARWRAEAGSSPLDKPPPRNGAPDTLVDFHTDAARGTGKPPPPEPPTDASSRRYGLAEIVVCGPRVWSVEY